MEGAVGGRDCSLCYQLNGIERQTVDKSSIWSWRGYASYAPAGEAILMPHSTERHWRRPDPFCRVATRLIKALAAQRIREECANRTCLGSPLNITRPRFEVASRDWICCDRCGCPEAARRRAEKIASPALEDVVAVSRSRYG